MNIDELLGRAGDQVGVHRVFGEPIERDGVVVIPVAVVMGGAGGGGGGSGPDEGVGGGVGMWARGIGAYEIRDGRLRFVPAVDIVSLGVIGLVLARILTAAARKARRTRQHRQHRG